MIDYITKSGFNNNLGSIHTPLVGVSFLLDREDLGFSFHASAVRVNKFPHAPWNRLVRSGFLHGVLPSPLQVIFHTLIPKLKVREAINRTQWRKIIHFRYRPFNNDHDP